VDSALVLGVASFVVAEFMVSSVVDWAVVEPDAFSSVVTALVAVPVADCTTVLLVTSMFEAVSSVDEPYVSSSVVAEPVELPVVAPVVASVAASVVARLVAARSLVEAIISPPVVKVVARLVGRLK
jgi:hypothetical protein